MGYSVFISHSEKDKDLALHIYQVLKAYHITPIIATKVKPSSPPVMISEKVQKLIDSSHAVLVILTPNGIASPWVQQEIGYAIKSKKSIVSLVDPRIPTEKLGFLYGTEYIPINYENLQESVKEVANWLYKLKVEKENSDALAALIVGAFILWLLSSK